MNAHPVDRPPVPTFNVVIHKDEGMWWMTINGNALIRTPYADNRPSHEVTSYVTRAYPGAFVKERRDGDQDKSI